MAWRMEPVVIDLDAIVASVVGEAKPKVQAAEEVDTGLPPGFEEFGFFPVEDRPALTPRTLATEQVRGLFGVLGGLHSPSEYLKPAGIEALSIERGVVLYLDWPDPAWQIEVDASSPERAVILGRRVLRNLIGVRSLGNAYHLHHWPLFVIYDTGYVRLEGPPKREKASGPTVSGRKRALASKARAFFGRRGASLTGSEGAGYRLALRPALKRMQGVFGEGAITGTLDELDAKLDGAIAQVKQRLGSG